MLAMVSRASRRGGAGVSLAPRTGSVAGTFRVSWELTRVEDRDGTTSLEQRRWYKPLFDELP